MKTLSHPLLLSLSFLLGALFASGLQGVPGSGFVAMAGTPWLIWYLLRPPSSGQGNRRVRQLHEANPKQAISRVAARLANDVSPGIGTSTCIH